ncbi:MAG: hypothetical protein JNL87_03980 [Burkholderiaceae bacterium]|nr:hypothetical protein [Burkholderiaceae bacterium]
MAYLTEEFNAMRKLCTSLATAALAAVLALPAPVYSVVPIVDSVGKRAKIRCGTAPDGAAVYAVHADKVIFMLLTVIQAADPADQQALNLIPRNTELDVKLLDDPTRIADLRGKVVTFLGGVNSPASRDAVRIIDVDYAMICPV